MIKNTQNTYTEKILHIPFVPQELRFMMTGGLGYSTILDLHGIRTAVVAQKIAEKINLSSTETEILLSASYLHDFGKLFVPLAILNKPARLNDEEYRQVKEHPETARKCLSSFAGYERIAIVVGQHHERMDGQGYPHRRKGQHIDPLARILSIADAYCAMTEDRPYQGAISHIAAIGRIQLNAGNQFDTEIVEAFTQCDLSLTEIHQMTIIRGENNNKENAA